MAPVPAGQLHPVQARYDDSSRWGLPRTMLAFLSQYWPLLGLGLVLAVTLFSAWRFNERIKAPLADILKSVERLSSGDASTWRTTRPPAAPSTSCWTA